VKHVLVLIVAVVSLGLSVYALTVASTTVAPVRSTAPRSTAELEGLERRLAALEELRRLERDTPDALADLVRRLEVLERRIETRPDGPEPVTAQVTETVPGKSSAESADPAEPRPEEVERFQKLQEAARRKSRQRHHHRRVAAVLAKSGLALDEKQTARLVEALGAFEPRRDAIWGEAKRAGAAQGDAVDWPTVIAETERRIVREFAETIAAFVPAGDAEVISRGLLSTGK